MGIDQAKSQQLLSGSHERDVTASSKVVPALAGASFAYLLCGILFLLFSGLEGGKPALMLLHVGSACALLFFWRQVRWGSGRHDSFGAAMLLVGAMLRLQAAVDAWVYGPRLEEIPWTVPLPDSIPLLLLKSEALSFFGTLLLVTVWRMTIGGRVGEFSFLNNYQQVGRRLPRLMYTGALVVQLLQRLAGENFGVLVQISSMTYVFGVVSIFFISALQKSRSRRVLLAFGLALPMAMLAIGGGMKEAILFPLIPVALLFWFNFKSVPLRVIVIVSGFVVLAYSQLYVQYVRDSTWTTGVKMSAGELIGGFQSRLGDTHLAMGMNAISSRINMTTTRAITVAIADARGFEPVNIFGPIPASFVPRALWPSKPVLQPGAQHTFRVQNINALASEATSATAAGFFSELYLGGGYVGWLVGAMVYGYLLARVQLFTLRRLPGFGHLALSFAAAYWALRFEENHVVYTYTSLFFIATFLFFFVKMTSSFRVKSSVYL